MDARVSSLDRLTSTPTAFTCRCWSSSCFNHCCAAASARNTYSRNWRCASSTAPRRSTESVSSASLARRSAVSKASMVETCICPRSLASNMSTFLSKQARHSSSGPLTCLLISRARSEPSLVSTSWARAPISSDTLNLASCILAAKLDSTRDTESMALRACSCARMSTSRKIASALWTRACKQRPHLSSTVAAVVFDASSIAMRSCFSDASSFVLMATTSGRHGSVLKASIACDCFRSSARMAGISASSCETRIDRPSAERCPSPRKSDNCSLPLLIRPSRCSCSNTSSVRMSSLSALRSSLHTSPTRRTSASASRSLARVSTSRFETSASPASNASFNSTWSRVCKPPLRNAVAGTPELMAAIGRQLEPNRA
mmetsp:Transcript_89585/g.252518  ORF Transcript_89585/g.252518 Transcript_89585/m.252518 type:complete len:373 (+) Transcript_89585:926-2044(+)